MCVLAPAWPWSNRMGRPLSLEMQLPHKLSQGPAEPGERSFSPWLPRLVSSVPQYSVRAMGVAVLCFACAVAVQIIFRSIGGSLMFATYYPAVLVAGLLAGLP